MRESEGSNRGKKGKDYTGETYKKTDSDGQSYIKISFL